MAQARPIPEVAPVIRTIGFDGFDFVCIKDVQKRMREITPILKDSDVTQMDFGIPEIQRYTGVLSQGKNNPENPSAGADLPS
jgi:hypothetical protein